MIMNLKITEDSGLMVVQMTGAKGIQFGHSFGLFIFFYVKLDYAIFLN